MASNMTPLERAEAVFHELVAHYGGAEDRELRAAVKLLLVALDKFRIHGGSNWSALLDEYVDLAKRDPERLERILHGNRGKKDSSLLA
ncbi:hypothetical protein ACW73L_16100 [Methylolobus aquaticus]